MLVDTTIKHDFEIYYQEDVSWDPPKNMHDHYEMIFMTGGCADIVVETKRYAVRPHSLIIINRFENHDIKITSYPYKCYVLSMKYLYCINTVRDKALLSILLQRPEGFVHVIPLEEPVYETVIELLERMEWEYKHAEACQGLCVEAFINLLFAALYRNVPDSFPIQRVSNIVNVVVELQRFICSNYKEEIKLGDLEKRCFLSRYYIYRRFKKITGYTLKDYLTCQRLMHAKELLANTDDQIAKIGEECGYGSANHFYRMFFQRESMSPLEYRRRARTISAEKAGGTDADA